MKRNTENMVTNKSDNALLKSTVQSSIFSRIQEEGLFRVWVFYAYLCCKAPSIQYIY